MIIGMNEGLSLQQRLELARRRRFVGRVAEREFVQNTLSVPELPFFVLHIFGPGGIGKTSLMREFADIGRGMGLPVAHIDARYVDPSPGSFLRAICTALNLPPDTDPVEYLASNSGRMLLLVDTYELLTPIDGWLREQFLPGLRGDIFVILAGRQPPALPWRTDSGWQEMMRILPLRNLGPEESRAYLALRGVPADQIDGVLEFTHGHALALSLVADMYDQGTDTQFRPEAAPNVIQTLLEQLVQQVPSPVHRAALEASSLVRLLTESLLAALLRQDDVREAFDWLRGLSFMETDRRGLFPHDLAREALTADVRWRHPDWYAELHLQARNYYMHRVQNSSGQEQRRLLADYVYLHRDNPSVRPFFQWQETGTVFTDGLRSDDVAALIAMVERHEGSESAGIAAHWLARQPHNISVLRGAGGAPTGFLARVTLEVTSAADRETDPVTRTIWELMSRKPLRAGETATLFRFWMIGSTYQGVSPEQSRLFLNMVQDYLVTPNLAYTFLPVANPEFWQLPFEYADLERLSEADFWVGDRLYGVYGHDWRETPVVNWLQMLADRELNMTPPGQRARPIAESLIVLSKADFATAVRDALRDYKDAASLAANPLIRSRMVISQSGNETTPAARAEMLRKLLRETAKSLEESPKLSKLYRAVYHTYLQPAITQEQAAELLDLPFSTYRRHLRSGIEEITSRLWSREIGNLET